MTPLTPINYVKIDDNARSIISTVIRSPELKEDILTSVFGDIDLNPDAPILPELPPTIEESEFLAYHEDEYRTDVRGLHEDNFDTIMRDYSITAECLTHDWEVLYRGNNESLYIDIPEQREVVLRLV